MALDYLVAVVGSRGLIEDRIQSTIDILTENGFLIVEQDTAELSTAQAQLLLGQSEGKIEAFTSGPCVTFLLKRTDAYNTFNSLRLELDYTYGSLTSWLALRDRAAFFPKTPVLERLFVLIKPSPSGEAGGLTYPEVMQLVQEYDFVVLGKEMKILGGESAKVVAFSKGEEKEEIEYLSSDMSIILCLEKLGAIQEFQLLIGPNNVEEARQYAPHTLRARLGIATLQTKSTPKYQNFLYASESSGQSAKDLAIFFPKPFPLERTVAILKPDLLAHHNPQRVIDLILSQGFTITAQKEIYISKLRAEQYLSALKGDPTYEETTKYYSSGPSQILLLTKPGALEHWQKLLGPEDPVTARQNKPNSLRAKLGTDRVHNALHGSASAEEANKDIEEFFPNMALERIPGLQELHDILSARPSAPARANSQTPQRSVYEVLIEGLTQLCRVKPTGDDAVIYLAKWLLEHNPYKPEIETPVEVKPQVTLSEEIDSSVSSSVANAPGPLTITWLVGAPGSHKSGLAARVTKDLLAANQSIEHIDVRSLLQQATKTSSEHGQLISEYLASSRVVPAPILTSLLTNALAKATSRNIILSAYPYSLDQSFDFERAIGAQAVKQLIYLEVTAVNAAKYAEKSGLEPQTYTKKLKTFVEDILPVVDQYDLFKKVKKIDVGVEEEEEVYRQLKKLVTPKK